MEDPLFPQPKATEDQEEIAVAAGTTSFSAVSTTAPSSSVILIRLAFTFFVAAASVWANYEASKGFEITVVNDVVDTRVARSIDLTLISNDGAARIVLDASASIERALYPQQPLFPKKPVAHVTLRLVPRASVDRQNLSEIRSSHGGEEGDRFVLDVGVDSCAVHSQIVSAIHRGMARVWLWDGQGEAPEPLLDALAEYLTVSAGAAVPVAEEEGSRGSDMVRFVRSCERRRKGFVARLNRAMRERWRLDMVYEALGSPEPAPAITMLATYLSSSSSPTGQRQLRLRERSGSSRVI